MLSILQKELLVISRNFKGRALDMCIGLFTNVIVFTYFTPALGVGGAAMLAGSVAVFGLFRVVDKAILIIADLDSDRRITYDLTYPLPSWMVFSSIAISSAMETSLIVLPLFPLGKILLFDLWDLSLTSWWRLGIIYLVVNLFYGFFGLWLASRIKNMREVANIWVRVIIPIYMFGCYFYPWKEAYALSPFIGMATLLNPLVYATEGVRSALCGPAGYLPFWICVTFLLSLTVLCGWHGCYSMKKRLDSL